MRDVKITIEDDGWSEIFDLAEKKCSNILSLVCDTASAGGLSIPAGAELSLVLTGDDEMQLLNRAHRGLDEPTNVLSFPGSWQGIAKAGNEAPVLLGDIVMARQTVVREAAEQGKKPEAHFCHLLVHGILHLLGYDHIQDQDAAIMEALEIRVLGTLNIDDPYEIAIGGDVGRTGS